MAISTLYATHFQDPDKTRKFLEQLRWDEPVCPHCGTVGAYKTKRTGVYRCSSKECRKVLALRPSGDQQTIVE